MAGFRLSLAVAILAVFAVKSATASYSPWTSWSDCDCDDETVRRTRTCQSTYSGDCTGRTWEERDCTDDEYDDENCGGLSAGEIAGIVVGAVVGLFLIIIICVICCWTGCCMSGCDGGGWGGGWGGGCDEPKTIVVQSPQPQPIPQVYGQAQPQIIQVQAAQVAPRPQPFITYG